MVETRLTDITGDEAICDDVAVFCSCCWRVIVTKVRRNAFSLSLAQFGKTKKNNSLLKLLPKYFEDETGSIIETIHMLCILLMSSTEAWR
jgi:hypothetical protein